MNSNYPEGFDDRDTEAGEWTQSYPCPKCGSVETWETYLDPETIRYECDGCKYKKDI